jgi:hypothetical protein
MCACASSMELSTSPWMKMEDLKPYFIFYPSSGLSNVPSKLVKNSKINAAMMLASILEKYINHKYMSKFQMPLVVVFAKLNINKLKINNEIWF